MERFRGGRVPEHIRRGLKAARQQLGWSQAELGRRVGLPQAHISGIETGRIRPRFDTLLEVARILRMDLLLVPASRVPMVHALVREAARPPGSRQRSLYGEALWDDEPPDRRPAVAERRRRKFDDMV